MSKDCVSGDCCCEDEDIPGPEPERNPYAVLEAVFAAAVLQASEGKGKRRHAVDGESFRRQQICEITRRVGLGFALRQAAKKIYECQRLPAEKATQELLGAMNYLAAAVISLSRLMRKCDGKNARLTSGPAKKRRCAMSEKKASQR